MPPIPKNADDITLIMRYHQGDAKAFDILYQRYGRKIYTYLHYKCNNKYLAEDLSQDTWVKAVITAKARARIVAKAEQGILKFPAYMFTTARNAWYDHIKALGSNEKSLNTLLEDGLQIEDDPDKQPQEQFELKELQNLFAKAVKRLPPEQKEAFILRRFKELSLEEIAEIQGVTREGVRSRLRAVMKQLKPILDQWRAP